MSSNAKRAGQKADDLIRANAAAADAKADNIATPDTPVEILAAEPVVAEVIEFEQAVQEPEAVDTNSVDVSALEQKLADTQAAQAQADQRWRSLDGQLRAKDAQIDRLTELVGKMTTEPAQPQAPQGVQTSDADDFGTEMVDFVQRLAASAAQDAVGRLAPTIQGLTNEVEVVSKHTAKSQALTFEGLLDKLSPSWSQLDTDQGFHDWLGQSPTRNKIFLEGAQTQDAEIVSDFFNMYADTLDRASTQVQAKENKRANELEKQVSPGKSRSTATASSVSPPDQKNWTRSEIAGAYSEYSKGNIPADEWGPLEKAIAAAQAEGRVDYST